MGGTEKNTLDTAMRVVVVIGLACVKVVLNSIRTVLLIVPLC